MTLLVRKANFSKGFIGRAVPRDKDVGGMPDAQNFLVSSDGGTLLRWPGFSRTYPYPLLNGLKAWSRSDTGAITYSATAPIPTGSESYTEVFGLRIVSVPPQALLLNSGRAIAVVDEYNGRIVALGYHAGGNPLRPDTESSQRAPIIEGRLFRLSKHEYPTVLYYNGKTILLSEWNEPKVYDGEVLRPLGFRAPQLPPVTEIGGTEIILDGNPLDWPTSDYSGDTWANNPYFPQPVVTGDTTKEYAWKMRKDAYVNYPKSDCFWNLAKTAGGKILNTIKWNPAWQFSKSSGAYTSPGFPGTASGQLAMVPAVAFRHDWTSATAAPHILCQRNVPPKACPAGASTYIPIPAAAKSITLDIYYDRKSNGSDPTFGLPPHTLMLVLSNTKIPVSGTAPFAPTSDITETIQLPITQTLKRKEWNRVELPWPGSDFQLRAWGIKKIADINKGMFSNKYNLNWNSARTAAPDWDATAGTSEYYIPADAGGVSSTPDMYTLSAVDFMFRISYKLGDGTTSFLFDDDYTFCFSWKNSVTGRESAPSPLTPPLSITAGVPVRMSYRGYLAGYPTGSMNTAPDGADKICVYMSRSQWGVDETTGGPLLKLMEEYDIPEDGAPYLYLGTERAEEDILLDRSPNYQAYSLPACGVGLVDGNRLLVAGQKDYSIGQVVVDSRSAYQIVTRVVATADSTPQFGPWCEGRTIHIEGIERDGFVVKAIQDTDGEYYSLLVSSGAEFLSEDSDDFEQETLDANPRKYTIKGEPRRMWWSAVTALRGADIEGMDLTNYADLDVSPDGINHLAHLGGLVVATSRDKTLYLAQNMGALDDAVASTGPAFSTSSTKPFGTGCIAGRTVQEIPGGVVWLTSDCGLAVATTEGITFHPLSEIMRTYLRQADKVSQFELQHAFAHYNKGDGSLYLFFFSPSGDILEWTDAAPPDPFVGWGG